MDYPIDNGVVKMQVEHVGDDIIPVTRKDVLLRICMKRRAFHTRICGKSTFVFNASMFSKLKRKATSV